MSTTTLENARTSQRINHEDDILSQCGLVDLVVKILEVY